MRDGHEAAAGVDVHRWSLRAVVPSGYPGGSPQPPPPGVVTVMTCPARSRRVAFAGSSSVPSRLRPRLPGRNLLGTEELPAKATRRLLAGQVITVTTPGGGGWGEPPG